MKKVMFVLVAVLMASPALAEVKITCTADGDGNNVIGFTSDEPNLVRAFALDITTSDGNITKVECLNADYYVYPGSIEISGGDVTAWGSCLCTVVLPANSVTIEMASLYQKGVDPAPGTSGDLVRVSYDAGATMVIAQNDLRGGVVMENPYEQPTVDIEECGVCVVPACWSNSCQCHGDADHPQNCEVKGSDFLALKNSWYQCYPAGGYNPCADFDRDGCVKGSDFLTLKNNWYKNVSGEPPCPPGDINNVYGCGP